MKKTLSRLTAVLLLALALAPALALPLEADHDCSGENCPVCALLKSCGQALDAGCPPASAVSRPVPAVSAPLLCAPATAVFVTPVARRTRLND